jgi:hypothetical protein
MIQQVQAEQQAQAQQEQAMQEQGAEQQMQDEDYQNALYEQEADAALNGVNGIYKYGGHKAQYGNRFSTRDSEDPYWDINIPEYDYAFMPTSTIEVETPNTYSFSINPTTANTNQVIPSTQPTTNNPSNIDLKNPFVL